MRRSFALRFASEAAWGLLAIDASRPVRGGPNQPTGRTRSALVRGPSALRVTGLSSGGDAGRAGDLISIPYSAAVAIIRTGSNGWTDAGGRVRDCAGSDSSRMTFSKPAGSATRRKRASGEVTSNVCGTVARAVHERPGGRLDHLAADPEGQLAFGDVEPPVFVVVDVQR